MLGVIPASSLTLLVAAGGLAIAAFSQGFVNLALGQKSGPVARTGAFGKAQPTRLEAIGKLCLGAILIGILVFSTFGFLRLSPPIPAPAVYVGILAAAILALASHWNCRVITRYMEIPFSSLLFRYSALTLIAALALIDAGKYLSSLQEFWSLLVPLESAELPALACAIGLIIWRPLNLFMPYPVAAARIHEAADVNSLERLFFRASNAQEVLMITMDDGKVYVGHLKWLPPNPQLPDAYFQILPSFSGYRDPATRRVTFTEFYVEVIQRYLGDEDPDDDEQLRAFIKVLPIRAVTSAGRFEPDVYLMFQDANAGDDVPSDTETPVTSDSPNEPEVQALPPSTNSPPPQPAP